MPTAPAQPVVPRDWSVLPTLDYRQPPANGSDFAHYVEEESRSGRCAAAVQAGPRWTLRIELAVLATADGRIKQVVPRAIDCPTVEQYASGLVSRLARNNIDTHGVATDGWYRTSLTFIWGG